MRSNSSMSGISWLWASGATIGCNLVGLRGRGAGLTACSDWGNGCSKTTVILWGESSRSNSASTSPELSAKQRKSTFVSWSYPTSKLIWWTRFTITVYGWLPQLWWMPLRLEKGLFEELPRHGRSRLIRCHLAFSSQSGVAGWHCPPVWILETHDDRKRDRPVLAGLSGGRRNRNTGDDGLDGVGGMGWRQNLWRCWYSCISGKWVVRDLQSFSPSILERGGKREKAFILRHLMQVALYQFMLVTYYNSADGFSGGASLCLNH